ncbi:MAG TPA: hypothetical protein ENN55_05855 [Firmicutes bacterium]|nr:hypothetical protein [Bacillota bacterium]
MNTPRRRTPVQGNENSRYASGGRTGHTYISRFKNGTMIDPFQESKSRNQKKTFQEKKDTRPGRNFNRQSQGPRELGKKLGWYEGGKRNYVFEMIKTDDGSRAFSITQTRKDGERQRKDTILVFEDHMEGFIREFLKSSKKIETAGNKDESKGNGVNNE